MIFSTRDRETSPVPSQPRTGTRLRALPMIGFGFATLAWMVSQVSSGALAVNFNTSNKEFAVYSNYIQGIDGASYLASSTQQDGTDVGVAEFGFKIAKLAGFCAVTNETVPIIGQVSLVITAGVPVRAAFDDSAPTVVDGAGNPIQIDAQGRLTGPSEADAVQVTEMFFSSAGVTGYGNKIAGMNLGQNASSVDESAGLDYGTDQGGPAAVDGNIGLYANNLNVAGLDGQTYGIGLAGAVSLPDLKIQVLTSGTQASCPEVAGD